MNLIQRVRRGGVVAAVIASLATAAGATGVNADDGVTDEPVATEMPADDGTQTPPGNDAGGEAPPTTEPAAPETTEVPETTEPTEPPSETAPPPQSTTPPTPPSTTSPPPAKDPSSPTPVNAIATTTTAPAAMAEPVSVVAKPSAPTSPVATPANGAVALTWKAPATNGGATIEKYAVQRYNTGSKTWVSIAYPTTLSYSNTGLSNGVSYSFRILAYNTAGWSAPSSVVTASPRTVPSAPTALVATPGNGSITLKWTKPASTGGATIVRYAVQRYNTVSKKWENVAFPTTTSHPVGGLSNGTKYSFRILAQNAAGWGTPSTVVAATPNGLSAPLSVVATPGDGKVTLSWQQPATSGGMTIDKYRVQASLTGTSGWTDIAFPTSRSYTPALLLNGTKYSFRIFAHTAVGYGPPSTVVSAVPRGVPAAPYYLQATPMDGYVSFKWSEPANAGAAIDKYRVQIATSPDGPWGTPIETVLTSGGWGGLVNGNAYFFRVAAHNAAGWGQYSWAVKAVPRTVPPAPGLTAQPVNPTRVKLNWTRPATNGGAPIELYRFEQALDPGGPWTVIDTVQAGDKVSGGVYVDGLDPGTTYHFRAAAQNAAGWGLDKVVSATTPATTPSAPTACSAIQSSYNIMYLDWNAPASDGGSPIINYNIVIEKGQKAWVWVIPPPQLGSWGYYYWHQLGIVVDYDTVGAFTDYYEDLPSGTYRIYIRARNSVGLGPACVVDWVYIS